MRFVNLGPDYGFSLGITGVPFEFIECSQSGFFKGEIMESFLWFLVGVVIYTVVGLFVSIVSGMLQKKFAKWSPGE